MHTLRSQPCSAHLLQHANESRCQHCPPDRICAWACVQGTGIADIVVGAVLEQSMHQVTARTEPGEAFINRALMDTYNR